MKHEDRAAFPCTAPVQTGMSLRDYFAAKAMHAILCGSQTTTEMGKAANTAVDQSQKVAQQAYIYADAMIAHMLREP